MVGAVLILSPRHMLCLKTAALHLVTNASLLCPVCCCRPLPSTPPHPTLPPPQTFHADFDPKDRDFRLAAALALGELRGKPLSDEALRRVVSREEVRGVHQLMGSGRLQGLGLDPLDVVQRVEQQQAAEKQQQQQQPAAA
jgi:hypothetical protein